MPKRQSTLDSGSVQPQRRRRVFRNIPRQTNIIIEAFQRLHGSSTSQVEESQDTPHQPLTSEAKFSGPTPSDTSHTEAPSHDGQPDQASSPSTCSTATDRSLISESQPSSFTHTDTSQTGASFTEHSNHVETSDQAMSRSTSTPNASFTPSRALVKLEQSHEVFTSFTTINTGPSSQSQSGIDTGDVDLNNSSSQSVAEVVDLTKSPSQSVIEVNGPNVNSSPPDDSSSQSVTEVIDLTKSPSQSVIEANGSNVNASPPDVLNLPVSHGKTYLDHYRSIEISMQLREWELTPAEPEERDRYAKIVNDMLPHICKVADCDRQFDHRQKLYNHSLTHKSDQSSEQKKVPCPTAFHGFIACPMFFENATAAQKHAKYHERTLFDNRNVLPTEHICDECEKGFYDISPLCKHVVCHPNRPKDGNSKGAVVKIACKANGQYGIRCHHIASRGNEYHRHLREEHGSHLYAMGINPCPHGPLCGLGFLCEEHLLWHIADNASGGSCRARQWMAKHGTTGMPRILASLRNRQDYMPGWDSQTQYDYDDRPAIISVYRDSRDPKAARVQQYGSRYQDQEALKNAEFVKDVLGLNLTIIRVCKWLVSTLHAPAAPDEEVDEEYNPEKKRHDRAVLFTENIQAALDSTLNDNVRILLSNGLDAVFSDRDRMLDFLARQKKSFSFYVVVSKENGGTETMDLLRRFANHPDVYTEHERAAFFRFSSDQMIAHLAHGEKNDLLAAYLAILDRLHKAKSQASQACKHKPYHRRYNVLDASREKRGVSTGTAEEVRGTCDMRIALR